MTKGRPVGRVLDPSEQHIGVACLLLEHFVALWCNMASSILVNIGLGKGLMIDSTKPLLERMLTYHPRCSVALCSVPNWLCLGHKGKWEEIDRATRNYKKLYEACAQKTYLVYDCQFMAVKFGNLLCPFLVVLSFGSLDFMHQDKVFLNLLYWTRTEVSLGKWFLCVMCNFLSSTLYYEWAC